MDNKNTNNKNAQSSKNAKDSNRVEFSSDMEMDVDKKNNKSNSPDCK